VVETAFITVREISMIVGDARARTNGLSCTNFLQERVHDLANSVTFFLSIFPPDIGKFF
jgi:hypothetical protein